jgi:HSP20 family molecular chaperone IbpA
MAERDISVRRESTPAGLEEVRRPENYLRPAVDIFESEDNLTLMADMPGVTKDHLDVHLEQGVLTLRGTIEAARSGELLFREFALVDYYRQFKLPQEIDPDKTSADFKNGVLTLTMPKSAAARPKRIEIRH